MSDQYDVLSISTEIVGQTYDQQNNRLKPFVAMYCPQEILDRMKWDRKTRLILSIEKGFLKISKNESDEELFTDELVYVPLDDE